MNYLTYSSEEHCKQEGNPIGKTDILLIFQKETRNKVEFSLKILWQHLSLNPSNLKPELNSSVLKRDNQVSA